MLPGRLFVPVDSSVVSKPPKLTVLPARSTPPEPAPLQAVLVSPFTLTHQSAKPVVEAAIAAWLNAKRTSKPRNAHLANCCSLLISPLPPVLRRRHLPRF